MKTYFLAPLLALALFVAYHWHATGELRRDAVTRQATLDASHAAALNAERIAQAEALTAALVEQDKQKAERAAQAARDLAAQAARQGALDTLAAARRRLAELTRQFDRLQQDLAAEKKSLAEIEAAKTAARSEQAFLDNLRPQAEANVKSLTDLLEKLAATEAARVAATKPAASR